MTTIRTAALLLAYGRAGRHAVNAMRLAYTTAIHNYPSYQSVIQPATRIVPGFAPRCFSSIANIEIPRLTWTFAKDFDPNSIVVSDIIPPENVRRLVHKEKKLGMNSAAQKSFAEIVQGVVLKAAKEGNENVSLDEVHDDLLKLCGNDWKDFAVMGIMLARHSIAGSPLGVLVLHHVATRSGDIEATFHLAQLLSSGCEPILAADRASARILIESLATQHEHRGAMYAKGMHMILKADIALGNKETPKTDAESQKTVQEAVEGIEWIRRGAEKGFVPACVQMGHILTKGFILERDGKKAAQYLKVAAEQGQAEALFLLGALHASGELSDSGPDNVLAFEYYLAAAMKGLAVAQHNVGSCYFEGTAPSASPSQDAPKRDLLRAIEFWEMAASQNFQLSLYNLGKLYAEGAEPEVQRDWKRAHVYLTKGKKIGGEIGEQCGEILSTLGKDTPAKEMDAKLDNGDGVGVPTRFWGFWRSE
ncbi:hypothetical protein BJ742DRAFT_825434 [Cladochytrium replicatum]|nr:hypothetical protein BJ742DRAFT_825434 [Cladochytrium replicatum]